jgi:hypothetical protein
MVEVTDAALSTALQVVRNWLGRLEARLAVFESRSQRVGNTRGPEGCAAEAGRQPAIGMP